MDVDTKETTILQTGKPLGQQSSTPTSKLHLEQTRLYYDENADSYASTTQAVELGPTWKLLAERLEKGSFILDLGCGAGRDLKYFAELGYRVVGIDYSQKLVDIAKRYSNQPVRLMDFHSLDFPENTFDAVWAIASLLHVARADIDHILRQIHGVLKPAGLFIASMKKGRGERVDERGRYFSDYLPGEWQERLSTAGFQDIQILENDEERKAADGTIKRIPWLVSICTKREG